MSVPRGTSMQSGALYRKYRPQTFEELVGQEAIARTLRNAVALGRVAHAYLFCGPRGTGKTSTARLLAKAVNCEHPDPWQRPCNSCTACRSIANGSAVDIVEIDAASNRGVDDIRDLREKVKYAPVELRTKFYIIDEAHQLTRDAFNAFLKTLEEPPAHVVFVLATTEPDKLPDTVASRCQRFDFRRLPLERVVERLQVVCDREGIRAERPALELIARRATGSLRDALGLLERLVVYASETSDTLELTLELAHQALGESRGERVVRLIDALAARDPAAALRAIAEAADAGEDLQQFGRDLIALLRSLLYQKAGADTVALPEDTGRWSDRFTLAELAVILRRMSLSEFPISRSGSDVQLALELAVVEAILELDRASSQPIAPLSDAARAPAPSRSLRATLPSDGQGASRSPQPISKSDVPRPDSATSSPLAGSDDAALLEQLLLRWATIRRELRAANSKAAALLADAEPRLIRGEEVVLVAPYEFHRRRINEEVELRRVIERVLARHLGRPCRIHCIAPEELSTLVPGDASSGSLGSEPSPKVIEEPDRSPRDLDLSPDDQRRLEAAKAIFEAVERTEA